MTVVTPVILAMAEPAVMVAEIVVFLSVPFLLTRLCMVVMVLRCPLLLIAMANRV